MTTPTTQLFVPPNTVNLKDITLPQIRLGLQGYPGTGKTWSALTAPNPIIANFDNKLMAHIGRDIPVIPFGDHTFLQTELGLKQEAGKGLVGHYALTKWIEKYGSKLQEGQTLVIDSLSSVMNCFDSWWNVNPTYSKKGEVDSYAPHKAKIAYMAELCALLKGLKCHVILTTHETPERDDEGRLTGSVRPLMTGQFADQLGGQFTDWFRQVIIPKMDLQRNIVNKVNGKELTNDVNYFWQIQTDSKCNCCTSLPDVKVKYTKADFKWVFIDKKYNDALS